MPILGILASSKIFSTQTVEYLVVAGGGPGGGGNRRPAGK